MDSKQSLEEYASSRSGLVGAWVDSLPDEIAVIDAEIALIEIKLAAPNLFQNDPNLFNRLADKLTAQKDSKDQKEMEWLEAAEKAEAVEQEGKQD